MRVKGILFYVGSMIIMVYFSYVEWLKTGGFLNRYDFTDAGRNTVNSAVKHLDY